MFPTPFYEYETKCSQDVDAMLQLLEELGPKKLPSEEKKKRQSTDDETYNTETSTVNDSFESGSDVPSDVSSDGGEEHGRRQTQHKEDAEDDDDDEEDKDVEDEEEMELEFIHMNLRGNDILPAKVELQQCSNDELLELLERMRVRLTQSLIDLSAEKVIRRSKEKSLEKLAKELCKRVCEGEMKDNQIKSLNCSLKKTAEALAELQKAEQKLKQECEDLKDEKEALKREHKAKMDAQVAEYTKQLNSLRESYNDELQNGKQIKEHVEEMETRHEHIVRKLKQSNVTFICLAAVGFSIASGYVDPEAIVARIEVQVERATDFTRDYMCAPVPPGFSLPDEVSTFDAPWWAPEGTKEACFSVCGDRSRSRLHWDWINNKLSAFTLGKNGKSTRLWTYRIPDADVSRGKILLKSRSGQVERKLVAPWVM